MVQMVSGWILAVFKVEMTELTQQLDLGKKEEKSGIF